LSPGYGRILLAVITAPRQAFEEIVGRRLIGGAIVLTALVGLVESLLIFYQYFNAHSGSLFQLATLNPLSSVGTMLIVSYISLYIIRMLGGEGDYPETAAVFGWASPITLIIYVLTQALGAAGFPAMLGVLSLAAQIWLIMVIGYGMKLAHSSTIWRGSLSYLVGLMVFSMAASLIVRAVPTLQPPVMPIPSAAAESGQSVLMSWIAAAGLAFGSLTLSRKMGYVEGQARKTALMAGLAGAAAAVVVTWNFAAIDPVGRVVRAYRSYEKGRFDEAASGYLRVLQTFPSDLHSEFFLGMSLYGSGKDKEAIRQFRRLKLAQTPQARRYDLVGIGAVRLAQGRFREAEKEIKGLTKTWPGEPNIWLGVAYARSRDWKKAIAAAEEGLRSGESAAGYLVLTEAYAATGQLKKAKEYLDKAVDQEPSYKRRFGRDPKGWIGASSRLTRRDLRFPLIPREQTPRPAPRSRR